MKAPLLFILPSLALAASRPLSDEDAAAGKPLYLRECSACHGERGRGDGPAAAFLEIAPRDFTRGQFKLRTTPSGEPPATIDVLQVIERGIPGSAMPSFRFLPVEDRRRIGAYVLQLADLLEEPEPAPVPPPSAPPAATPTTIARGKQVYEEQGCGSCHGPQGRGDGPAAKALHDDEGRPIQVRDFTSGVFRGGSNREDLYYRFVTGMDGSPMPAFAETVLGEDRWSLVDYVMSLRVKAAPPPIPHNPVAAGRAVAAKYGCRGCHVLDDGKGGEVGPDLRVAGQKLKPEWVKGFLSAPREQGKIYPWRPHRMPDLALAPHEVEVLTTYLAAIGRHRAGEEPDVAAFPSERLATGQNLFAVTCAQCHALGAVVPTPLAAQQGPDLIRVSERIDYQWAKRWISNPKKIDPKTRMTIPYIKPEEVDSVRMFIWKASKESGGLGAGSR